MSSKTQKNPSIRFKGFTDAWEQRKLGELASVYDGTHQTPDYKDKGVMFLSVENIKTLKSKKYISEEAFSKEFTIRPEKNDVLMTRIGDVGTANVVADDTPIAYYVSLALLKSKLLNPFFLQASIHSPFMKDELWKRTLHIAFPKKINKNEIANVPISYPSIEEQTKIGSFFKQLDDTIALHQRQLDNYKELKKAMMQKIFNQELRFKDEEGKPFSNWKKSTLGRLLTIERGGSPRPIYNYITTEENGINWIKIGDVSVEKNIITSTKEKIKPEGLKKTRRVYKGDLILSNSMSYGRPYILEIDGAIHDGWLLLRDEEGNFDKNYLCFMLSSDTVMKQYKMLAAGGVVDNLNSQLVKSVKVNVPAISEQQKIAEFLTALDQRTEKVAKRIESMKKQKKGLMQQMFI